MRLASFKEAYGEPCGCTEPDKGYDMSWFLSVEPPECCRCERPIFEGSVIEDDVRDYRQRRSVLSKERDEALPPRDADAFQADRNFK